MIDATLEMPARIKKLPVNEAGYPVPWFVAWIDGKPDFRVVGTDKIRDAVRWKLCWICGEPLGSNLSFVLAPLGVIKRTSGEPPSHRECAIFLAKEKSEVTLVWTTTSDRFKLDENGDLLFHLGPAHEAQWFAFGHAATREQVEEIVEEGFSILKKLAEGKGLEAMEELTRRHAEAIKLLPAVTEKMSEPEIKKLAVEPAVMSAEAPAATAATAAEESKGKTANHVCAEGAPGEYLFRCAKGSGDDEIRAKVIVEAKSKSKAKELMRQVLNQNWRWLEILAVKNE